MYSMHAPQSASFGPQRWNEGLLADHNGITESQRIHNQEVSIPNTTNETMKYVEFFFRVYGVFHGNNLEKYVSNYMEGFNGGKGV